MGILLIVLITVVVNPLLDRVRETDDAEFRQYRRGLVENELAVINLEGDAYSDLLRVADADGNDLTKFRSVDALTLRTPANGRVILTTAGTYESVLSWGQNLTFVEIPVTVQAGEFLDAHGHRLSRNEAKDFYASALRDDWLSSALKSLLLRILNPEPENNFE